jgi:tetratricopeptide (TPR) repeat protein
LEREQCERCLQLKEWCAAERLVASHTRGQLYLEILAYFVVLGQSAALAAVRRRLQPLLEIHQAIHGLTLMVRLLDIVRQKVLPAFLGPADKTFYTDDGAARQLAAQLETSEAAGEAPNIAVLLATGLAYEATGDPLDLEKATAYYRRASQCAPDAYEPYLLLGRSLAQRGRHQEADDALRKAAQRLARAVQPEQPH